MDREIKEIKIYQEVHEDGESDGWSQGVIFWIIFPDELPGEDDESYDEDLEDQEMIEIPDDGFFYIYYYNGQLNHFFTEEI